MKLTSISEAESALQEYIPNSSLYIGDNMTLSRMWPLLGAVGNPHKKLKVIHLAGTSGKTSTAYFVSALLKSSGEKIGLSVSPHVDSITERVQIDGEPLENSVFCNDLGEFIDLIKDITPAPSYFELMIAFVMWEFVKHKVDYAVLETGLGGLLDSTNVVTRDDKICVITDIGIDHTSVLGDTLGKIAEQKAGIIQGQNIVIMYEQGTEVMKQVQERVESKHAKLTLIKDSSTTQFATKLQIELLPMFQRRNWTLASAVAKSVSDRDNLEIDQSLDPLTITIPGRMEQRTSRDGSLLIMDGAHNQQKMTAFIDAYVEKFPGQKATVILGMKKDKEFKAVINVLQPIIETLIVASFNKSQDLPVIPQDPEVISDYAISKGIKTIVIKDYKKAYAELVKSKQNIKIITGSFYLLAQIRRLLQHKK